MDKHGVAPTTRLFLISESHELDSIPELIRPWGEQMEWTTGIKDGDAGVKNGVFTPGGVERRNDGIGVERVKHSDGKSKEIIRIMGGLGKILSIGTSCSKISSTIPKISLSVSDSKSTSSGFAGGREDGKSKRNESASESKSSSCISARTFLLRSFINYAKR